VSVREQWSEKEKGGLSIIGHQRTTCVSLDVKPEFFFTKQKNEEMNVITKNLT
jgi:hypothetical protein